MNPLLQKILDSNRIATGYLITGLDAEEDLAQARSFAQALSPGGPTDLIILSAPEGALKIDQVREMTRRLSFKPIQGGRVVVLIEEADRLTEGAANALLKTLEEPPPYALFLLVTAIPERLPATVRSRLHRINLPAPTLDLRKRWGAILPFWTDRIVATLAGRASFSTASGLAEETVREIDDLPPLLDLAHAWWRDLAILQETEDPSLLVVGRSEGLSPLLAKKDADQIYAGLAAIVETSRAIEGNVLKQLALERLFFRLM